MADKNINQLPEVTAMGVTDLFVLEQAGAAKKLTGQLLKASLMTWLQAHGGIRSIVFNDDDTMTITASDDTAWTSGSLRGASGRSLHLTSLLPAKDPGSSFLIGFASANAVPSRWAAGDILLNPSNGTICSISKIDGKTVTAYYQGNIRGPQGLTPNIGDNGNWWVGDTDTGVAARGDTGTHGSDVTVTSAAVAGTEEHPNGGVKLTITETIYDETGAASQVNTIEKTIWNGNTGPQGTAPHIGDNGHWYVGDVDTGVNAKGDKGDGLKIDGSVPTYADLPTLTAADMGKTYLVDADGRLYFWSGTAWPASGSGLLIKGEDGVTPNIGANGHWWIGTTDTGVQAQGEDGAPGAAGSPGAPGADGKSAYESAQDGGYTGTETQFNNDLAGVGNKQDKITGAKGKYLGFTDTDTLGAMDLPSASTGSKGITYLVDSYTRTDTDKAATAKAVNNVYKLVQEKADKSDPVPATLLAASWTGDDAPYTYTLSVTGVTTTSNQEYLPALDITTEQLKALQAANIQDGGQAAGTATLKAFGTKPTIDLPIRIIKRGDA